MSDVSSSLAELVELLNDGIAFYQDAAHKVADPALSQLMLKMSHLKRAIASDLNAEIALEGETPREHGSWFGGMRRTYAELLAKLGEVDGERDLIDRLEEHEDQLLAAFREATKAEASDRVRDLALTYFPEIEAMHARMRDLKMDRPPAGPVA